LAGLDDPTADSIEPPAMAGAKPGDGGDAKPPNDGDKIARLDQHRGHHGDQEAIAAFSAGLPLRPEAERVRERLAAALVAHVDDLWPAGEPAATPEWIAANVNETLATMERLYAVAAVSDQPGAIEFLDRMSWLPPLLASGQHVVARGAKA
jgi:hypothetical protein